jgi:hypothetical protein
MDSRENHTDKARRLQDELIKADRNYFLTWDQWVPPKLGPTRSIEQENLPAGFKYSTRPTRSRPTRSLPTRARNHQATRSTMPVRKAYADAIASKHFGKKGMSLVNRFSIDLYLDHIVFDMCWDAEPEPSVETPMASSSAEPQYGGQSEFMSSIFYLMDVY